jgi:hypothetical protein
MENNDIMYSYFLANDNGGFDIELPLLLPIKTIFFHETVIYKVWNYAVKNNPDAKEFDFKTNDLKDLMIWCERDYELTSEIRKDQNFIKNINYGKCKLESCFTC